MLISYRHIVQEMQLENAKAAQRNKVLESENKLLLTEVDQLREVRILLLLPYSS
jgi:hypothetical protein